jgi:hypothetical protein
MGDNKENWED